MPNNGAQLLVLGEVVRVDQSGVGPNPEVVVDAEGAYEVVNSNLLGLCPLLVQFVPFLLFTTS